MEIWQIIAICILLFPLFYAANYFVVKRMVAENKKRDDAMERAISAEIAKDMSTYKSRGRFKSRPRYGSKQRKLK